MLNLGTIEISKLAIGANEAKKAYVGSVLIYESGSSPTPPTNEIWYTTSDGKAITLSKQTASDWGAAVSSNTYSGGKGIIQFNGTVTKLGQQVLDAKTTLTSITLPSSITEIGNYAMRDCSALTSITIPENVTSIGQKAFGNCNALTTVNYNATAASCEASGTSSIPFSGITLLPTVNIGANVTKFGKNLFGQSSSKPKITNMYVKATNPPAIENSGALPGTANIEHIYIPAGTLSAYKSATTWSGYASKMVEC